MVNTNLASHTWQNAFCTKCGLSITAREWSSICTEVKPDLSDLTIQDPSPPQTPLEGVQEVVEAHNGSETLSVAEEIRHE